MIPIPGLVDMKPYHAFWSVSDCKESSFSDSSPLTCLLSRLLSSREQSIGRVGFSICRVLGVFLLLQLTAYNSLATIPPPPHNTYFVFYQHPWNWKWHCGPDGCIWNDPQSYTWRLLKPWRWNEEIMEFFLVSTCCRLATASARPRRKRLRLVFSVCECSRDQPSTLTNSSGERSGGMFDHPRKKKKKKKTGPFLEGRQSGEGWHGQRAKALVDACHPPLRFLWLAFVVLETANSCMQMALFPKGWPPLFCAWVWQGRFLCSIKEGVAFSQIRVPPPWSQQEYFKIVCLLTLFYSWYYW